MVVGCSKIPDSFVVCMFSYSHGAYFNLRIVCSGIQSTGTNLISFCVKSNVAVLRTSECTQCWIIKGPELLPFWVSPVLVCLSRGQWAGIFLGILLTQMWCIQDLERWWKPWLHALAVVCVCVCVCVCNNMNITPKILRAACRPTFGWRHANIYLVLLFLKKQTNQKIKQQKQKERNVPLEFYRH